ncbi:MAG: hypothetical protein U0457_16550 [Candidatus Sericytochromatia bacterium]
MRKFVHSLLLGSSSLNNVPFIANSVKPKSFLESIKSEPYSPKPITEAKIPKIDNLKTDFSSKIHSASANSQIGDVQYKFVDSSENIDLEGKNKKDTKFFYVNGINTNEKDANTTAETLSSLTNKKVNPIYNPTEGMAKDALEASGEMLTNSANNAIDRKAANIFYETLKSGHPIKIIAHSQGAAITANALNECKKRFISDGLNPESVSKMMANCQVITLGGFTSIKDFPKEVKILEMKEKKDPIPKIAVANKSLNSDDFVLNRDASIKSLERKERTIGNSLSISSQACLKSIATGVSTKNRFVNALGNTIGQIGACTVSFLKAENPIAPHLVDSKYLQNYFVKDAIRDFASSDLSNNLLKGIENKHNKREKENMNKADDLIKQIATNQSNYSY